MATVRMTLEEVVGYFDELEDPRSTINQKHPLVSVVVIALMGVLAGASGLWMTYRADLWERFADSRFWWMHAMVAIWLVFAAMLFAIEPLFLHRRMEASPDPARDFARMEWGHRVLLAASLVTVFGAVAGSHGWFF